MEAVRAAFLPDTFHEVNGVAHTARQFEAFARRRQLPFLSVHCGPACELTQDGSVTVMQLKRGRASFALDANLDCDPLLMRYASRVMAEVKRFGADLIHITGPGDLGMLGCYVAWRLRLPLVISWHTSFHEYAARRLESVLSFLGRNLSRRFAAAVEHLAFRYLAWFYRRAAVTLAPNHEAISMLREITGRPVFLMRRGVDRQLFSPARRHRISDSFRIGYVGRLTAEKNVRFLGELAKVLRVLGRSNFELVIVGEGREESWLRKNIPEAIFTGVLRGQRLAEVYANLDLFVFPSTTDTFGNVVLEALSSGVPVIVRDEGGPKFLVGHGVTGFIAATDWDAISFANQVMTDPKLHRQMRDAARRYACSQSWDNAFEQVLDAYSYCGLAVEKKWLADTPPLLSSRLHERDRS